jgi:hypothetical protein
MFRISTRFSHATRLLSLCTNGRISCCRSLSASKVTADEPKEGICGGAGIRPVLTSSAAFDTFAQQGGIYFLDVIGKSPNSISMCQESSSSRCATLARTRASKFCSAPHGNIDRGLKQAFSCSVVRGAHEHLLEPTQFQGQKSSSSMAGSQSQRRIGCFQNWLLPSELLFSSCGGITTSLLKAFACLSTWLRRKWCYVR